MREQRNIETQNDLSSMMRTIHHWLNYTAQVSRIDLLAESSLRFPIMEYIERSLNHTCCFMERPYEDFADTKFKNTKFVDVMWETEKCDVIMELKYVRENMNVSSEKQRYFNDIVRMGLALGHRKNENKDRRCFFITCGQSEPFMDKIAGNINIKNANSLGDKENGGEFIENNFNEWLCFESGEKVIEKEIRYPSDKDAKFASYFSNFIKEYYEEKGKTEKDQLVDFALYKDLFPEIIFTNQISLICRKDNVNQSLGLWEISITSKKYK